MTGSASKSPGATAPATNIALGLASRHSLRAFIAQRVGQDRLALVGDAPYRMDVGAEDLTDANNAFGEAGFLISWVETGRRSAGCRERRRFFTRKRASRIPHAVALTGPSPPRRPAAWRSP